MTGWLRRAGRGRLPDGTLVLWSVAEGRSGRRWRTTTVHRGVVERSLLLELTHDGRPTKLELAGPAGLLTLHPHHFYREAHGNVVGADGVRGLAFEWSPDQDRFHVDGDVVMAAVLARDVARRGLSRADVPALSVDAGLGVRRARVMVERSGLGTWTVECAGDRVTVGIDAGGCPIIGADDRDWPL